MLALFDFLVSRLGEGYDGAMPDLLAERAPKTFEVILFRLFVLRHFPSYYTRRIAAPPPLNSTDAKLTCSAAHLTAAQSSSAEQHADMQLTASGGGSWPAAHGADIGGASGWERAPECLWRHGFLFHQRLTDAERARFGGYGVRSAEYLQCRPEPKSSLAWLQVHNDRVVIPSNCCRIARCRLMLGKGKC